MLAGATDPCNDLRSDLCTCERNTSDSAHDCRNRQRSDPRRSPVGSSTCTSPCNWGVRGPVGLPLRAQGPAAVGSPSALRTLSCTFDRSCCCTRRWLSRCSSARSSCRCPRRTILRLQPWCSGFRNRASVEIHTRRCLPRRCRRNSRGAWRAPLVRKRALRLRSARELRSISVDTSWGISWLRAIAWVPGLKARPGPSRAKCMQPSTIIASVEAQGVPNLLSVLCYKLSRNACTCGAAAPPAADLTGWDGRGMPRAVLAVAFGALRRHPHDRHLRRSRSGSDNPLPRARRPCAGWPG